MTTISIDTYALINALKDAGATEQLARVQAKHDFKLDDITTNKDLDARIKETELKI